ncbi:hypothetical protein SEA_WENTWORTH_73 [Streptomyces phage Wentworth]|nr:hypothetical protein SEA_WENTWORTH_73 [Streptomyces phage Wentworth]
MKWDQIPEGTSFAMSQKGVDELRAGKPKAFGVGIICGVILTISLQSCGSDGTKTTDKPKPGTSVSTTHKPGN